MVRDQIAVRVVDSDDAENFPWRRWTSAFAREATNPKSLSLAEFEELCDDPARDMPGGVNVRAVLMLDPEEGFYLSAHDGEKTYLIDEPSGKRIKFRTIESALALLQNISGLSPDIGLLQASPARKQHH